ncbi:eukaryotic peptide chain release factor GTP-binding subunit ERF3A-like [Watersipora subatra]|uniref:eukaryotic peptide chain release factor GTP-binding subunit ERF3A-like n=1 Tax=Watersipora subatra TaxID=2589382 RepID=UPI00355B5123
MSDNDVPDSWDDNAAAQDLPIQKPLSTLSFNPDAVAFVPGKNVHATTFVPTAATYMPGNSSTPAHSQTNDPTSQSTSDINPAENTCLATEDTSTKTEPVAQQDTSKTDKSDPPDGRGEGTVEEPELSEGAVQVAKVKAKPKDLCTENKKEHVNIVFIGHVDAGKSTIGGRVLQLTGMVDKRTLEKYEKEAKEKNRETWYLSWALDTNSEERDKGKTVEVGRAYFETEKRHFTILDAPGHNSFVPNMIGGAAQADIAVLVISARKGEFETGFERKGQTREHAMLVKTAGVKRLVVLINKMDDPTVKWDESRYKECREKLMPYLKKLGYNMKQDVMFLPCSGLTGAFIKDPPPDASKVCPWYKGPTFLDYIEALPAFTRQSEGPVRIPVVDRYKDMGTIALGKVESGQVYIGQKLVFMPNKRDVEIMTIWSDEIETEVANTGENVKLKLKNAEEEDIQAGFVLCSPDSLVRTSHVFDAQVQILEHKSIICAGYSAVLHIHTCSEEVIIKSLIALVNKKTGEKTPKPRFIKQDQIAIVRLEILGGLICLETFKDFPQMGRFTLRDEGKTVAMGKVLKVIDS